MEIVSSQTIGVDTTFVVATNEDTDSIVFRRKGTTDVENINSLTFSKVLGLSNGKRLL